MRARNGISTAVQMRKAYSTVKATPTHVEVEFVCIPRPVARSETDDGGPLRYRVVHRTALWKANHKPVIEQIVREGDPKLSL